MNNYLSALLIVLVGILMHYFIYSNKEGLTNKDTANLQEKEDNAKWQGTVNWYTKQLNNLLTKAKKQETIVTSLEKNNNSYNQILKCLQYREKLMNSSLEKNRSGRQDQKTNSKNNLVNAFNSVKL